MKSLVIRYLEDVGYDGTHIETAKELCEKVFEKKDYDYYEVTTFNYNVVLAARLLKMRNIVEDVIVIFNGKYYPITEDGFYDCEEPPHFHEEFVKLMVALTKVRKSLDKS
jgi:GTP1/Obg family GTP-binding protein